MDRKLAISAWVMFSDKEWVRDMRRHLDPDDFPRSAMRWLVAKVTEVWDKDRSLLRPELLQYAIENDGDLALYGTTAEEAADFYLEVLGEFEWDDDSAAARRTIATKWLRELRVTTRLDRAKEAHEAGDLDEAERLMRKSHQNEEFRSPLTWQTTELPAQRPAIATGLEFVNNRWRGGLHLGQVGIILAPSNVGKSMFLPWFTAQALKAQKNVLYYTDEVPEVDIFRRIVSALTGEPILSLDFADAKERALADLRRRAIGREDEHDRADLQIMFRDAGELTVRDIEADIARQTELGIPPHLIVLDGDDIGVADGKRWQSLYEMYYHIYSQVSNLAVTRDVAVWTAAQATREAFKRKKLEPHHFGDSMAKMRKADVCIGMNSTEEAIDEGNERRYIQAHVLKDRYYGTKGTTARLYARWGKGTEGVVGFSQQEEHDE